MTVHGFLLVEHLLRGVGEGIYVGLGLGVAELAVLFGGDGDTVECLVFNKVLLRKYRFLPSLTLHLCLMTQTLHPLIRRWQRLHLVWHRFYNPFVYFKGDGVGRCVRWLGEVGNCSLWDFIYVFGLEHEELLELG